jgi:hypothetical protein
LRISKSNIFLFLDKSNKYSILEQSKEANTHYKPAGYGSNPKGKKFKEDEIGYDDPFESKNTKNMFFEDNPYRMDDTINIVRNPNLSVNDQSYPDATEEVVDKEDEIEIHFGKNLLESYENLFDIDEDTGKSF